MADEEQIRALPAWAWAVLFIPQGMGKGFVAVAIGYVLGDHGVSVAAIAAISGLYLLPMTWGFIAGPVIDVTLSPRLWFAIGAATASLAFAGFALLPLSPGAAPAFAALGLAASVAVTIETCAAVACMIKTTVVARRASVAGWFQTAQLGGAGIGGGLALWIATRTGGLQTPSLVVAAVVALSALPMLALRTPPNDPLDSLRQRAADVGRALKTLVVTRAGVLVVVVMLLPLSEGAATSLLPAVAKDWSAGADLVALISGTFSGVFAIPGCLAGRWICRRWSSAWTYMTFALAFALVEAGMALSPHTPFTFAGFLLLASIVQGAAWAAVSAVAFEATPVRGAASVNSVLASISNVPWVGLTFLSGVVQVRLGTNGMLLAEAALAIAAVGGYAALTRLWPRAVPLAAGAPA